ncbi:hypothetical protein RHGRI_032225 [Rhododendron griersonianum]|uniref:RING-type domain-containing protein n=1 Tax=Rhododendron griersonianum TaxID=479676 RepID=A0AAV6IGT9_9ERIC|nr:hypothetical protein RHGRI_032225 [Rhododendron griersonianum]
MILFYLIMFFQRTVTTFWKRHASCLTMEFGICFAWGIIYEGVCFPCIGDCILQYWNHGAALKPCKCPMCSQPITRLIPEASFDHCQNVEVLQNVQKYNRIFVGGTYGLILKVLESPFLIKRIIREMMDPDAANNHLFKVRLFAVKLNRLKRFHFPFPRGTEIQSWHKMLLILLGALYSVCHFDFLPTGRMDAINFFDNFAIGVVLILYMIGLYRRWRRLRLVRQLAIAQP